MIRVYFKQSWQLIKQNKIYSSVYIIGTGLAIAMTMVVAIIYFIKLAPLYPENNRDRTLVMKYMMLTHPDSDRRTAARLSYHLVKEHLYTLQSAEAVGAVLDIRNDYPVLKLDNERGHISPAVKYVNHDFWKVFTFKFINGKPFTEPDVESGIKTAVISASLANTLYGTVLAEGNRMMLDNNEYRIAGVVEDAFYATPASYAHIWVPFTVKPQELNRNIAENMIGRVQAYILAPSVAQMQEVRNEVADVFHKINTSQDKFTLHLNGQPDPYWESNFRTGSTRDIPWSDVFKTLGIVLLALLIIPAVNLAGMVSSRMDKRLSEMGIRKAFGASRSILFNQIIVENFLLTLLGGLAGVIISFLIIYFGETSVWTLFDDDPTIIPEGTRLFSWYMLINLRVLVITIVVCFILNLVSAIIPAYNGLKKNIIYSLNKND